MSQGLQASGHSQADQDLPRGGGAPAPLVEDPNPGLWFRILYACYDLIWISLIVLLSPWWVLRCLRSADFRRMARERMTLPRPSLSEPDPDRGRILVHGVSVGEVKASQSLVAALREDYEVVVSASTNTGMEVARQLYPDLAVVRFPLDLALVARRFLRRVQPRWVVLMELELWPNFLKSTNRMGSPVAVASGRITESSFRNYKRFSATVPQFNRISVFAAQDERYAARFSALAGSDARVVVTGNVKVDGLRTGPPLRDAAWDRLRSLAGPRPGQAVLVAGSTHEPEEGLVLAAFRRADPKARIVIVPRHPPRAEAVIQVLASQGESAQRWTDILSESEDPDPSRPLVVDTIGELERVYGLADAVFVGGTLIPHGGQNMLEPAAQGLPVLYGPNTGNFSQEAALLEEAGAAMRVKDADELGRRLAELLADDDRRQAMSVAGIAAVDSQRGATARTLQALRKRLRLD